MFDQADGLKIVVVVAERAFQNGQIACAGDTALTHAAMLDRAGSRVLPRSATKCCMAGEACAAPQG